MSLIFTRTLTPTLTQTLTQTLTRTGHRYANVETFIVFRATTPVIICVLDWLLLGRELPSLRSILSIAALIVGATAYVATDTAYEVCHI